ncbi:uncharacterized protein PHACADRAFT_252528 [Phanerochaete carnosa HHB-10118-sp]|uniref:Uncharacterized protein n=1 Tax=Phanerochaete carnosa (strain HHB-10118-sp) TaxID=650164 RepID=K5V6K0_PHACS|nr:uncharacterized protein PHACADRAFT_252528 [Phanerochaete carnosa HHB-10118-sp]EKM58311.1 hypothetical protein PHACADRAFT_252528 [Phanerochaete carnosa HHB-10118-sp]
MKNVLLALITVAVSTGFAAAQFQVNTPNNVLECVPTQITWTAGGTAPYVLVVNANDANGAVLEQFSGINQTSFTWTTDIPSGQAVGFNVRDATGTNEQSAAVTILPGTSTSCITSAGASATPTSAASTGGSTSGGVPSTASTSGLSASNSAGSGTGSASSPLSTAPSSSGSSGSSGTSSASGSSPSTTGGSNGALGNSVAIGAVGFIGAAVAAIMA